MGLRCGHPRRVDPRPHLAHQRRHGDHPDGGSSPRLRGDDRHDPGRDVGRAVHPRGGAERPPSHRGLVRGALRPSPRPHPRVHLHHPQDSRPQGAAYPRGRALPDPVPGRRRVGSREASPEHPPRESRPSHLHRRLHRERASHERGGRGRGIPGVDEPGALRPLREPARRGVRPGPGTARASNRSRSPPSSRW